MWAWVSADREFRHGGPLGWVLLVQVGLGVILVAAALVLGFVAAPWWFALAAVPLFAALPWGRMAPLLLVLTYSLAAFGPLILAQLAAIVVFRIVEAIVEVVTGGDPASVLRPTVAAADRGEPTDG